MAEAIHLVGTAADWWALVGTDAGSPLVVPHKSWGTGTAGEISAPSPTLGHKFSAGWLWVSSVRDVVRIGSTHASVALAPTDALSPRIAHVARLAQASVLLEQPPRVREPGLTVAIHLRHAVLNWFLREATLEP